MFFLFSFSFLFLLLTLERRVGAFPPFLSIFPLLGSPSAYLARGRRVGAFFSPSIALTYPGARGWARFLPTLGCRVGGAGEKGPSPKKWLGRFIFCMAVSRFGRIPIQMNFAENRNAATSPILAADPFHLAAGPTRGKGQTKEEARKGDDRRPPTDQTVPYLVDF